DVAALGGAQPADEIAHGLGDELNASRRWIPGRVMREDKILRLPAERSAHLEAPVERPPPQQLRVDRALECRQAVEALRCRAIDQPLEVVVLARDVAVGARRDVDDDLPFPPRTIDLLWILTQHTTA